MLEVQKYLKNNTIEKLNEEYGITATFHETEDLVILNYDQINSKQTYHPIVCECRSLVLNSKTWELVSKSYTRFFNFGEGTTKDFDWSEFKTWDKEDGSIISIFWYNNKWNLTTRSTFGNGTVYPNGPTFLTCILHSQKIFSLDELKLDKKYNYICEFCSKDNKIIRNYDEPKLYLISAFEGSRELTYNQFNDLNNKLTKLQPLENIKTKEDVFNWIKYKEKNDPTYEGVVVKDKNELRLKIKSKSYLGISYLVGNRNQNLTKPHKILPIILSNEVEEVKCYFEEFREIIERIENCVKELIIEINSTWKNIQTLEKKPFALEAQKTDFEFILFTMKHGKELKDILLSGTTAMDNLLNKRTKL